jgi:FkbM family methyltransferase
VRRGRRIVAALVLVLIAGLTYMYGNRLLRKGQFRLTGSVRALGHTYYLQLEDQVITPVVLDWGVWERPITEQIQELLHPGDTFLDVGADFGWYTVIAADVVGPGGRVIAFEPAPENRAFLKRNVAANALSNTVVEPVALSNKPGKLTFHLNQTNTGDHSLLASQGRPGTMEVEATSLDLYLKDFTGEVSVVKIDTQGAEGLILEGMRQTMQRYPKMILIVEFTPDALRQTGHDPEAMLRQFHDQGYEVHVFNDDPGRLRRGRDWRRTRLVPPSEFAGLVKRLDHDQYVNLMIKKT